MDDQKVWEALDRLAVVVTGIEVGMPRKDRKKRTGHQHNNAFIRDDDTTKSTQGTGNSDDDQYDGNAVNDRRLPHDNQYADGRDSENGSDDGSDSNLYGEEAEEEGEDETDEERSDGEISGTNPDKSSVPNGEDEYSVRSDSHLQTKTKFQSRPNRRVYFSNFGPNSY